MQDATIYIVDDDPAVRDATAWLLRSKRLYSETFPDAQKFVAHLGNWPAHKVCCLLLDIRMPGLSGLELFDWLLEKEGHSCMPVIFLTGHADVSTAVEAVKRGAFDFFEKPFSNNRLVDRVQAALQASELAVAARLAKASMAKKLSELTEREQAVLYKIVDGLPNKLIADDLTISVRTVEVHRARVFEKMNVKSAVELANVIRQV